MSWLWISGPLAWRRLPGVLIAGMALVSAAALTGCGAVAAAGSGSATPAIPAGSAHAALCADPGAASRVQIIRFPSIGQLQTPVSGGAKRVRITVTDPVRARALARAVCALPRMPKGTFHCPISFGGGFRLSFIAAGQRLPVVEVMTSGCETVTGAGPVRWATGTPAFWGVLGRVAGVTAVAHRP